MNGKIKGSQFEREICKQLSLWISYDERDDIFWRSAMSGGRTTVGLKKGIVRKTQGGDITAIDPIGNKLTDKFIVECKYYRNIHLESMLFGVPKNNSIYEFWMKLNMQAVPVNKEPLLIIKQNNSHKLMGIRNNELSKTLKESYGIRPIAVFSNLLPNLNLYIFEYIMDTVDPIILNIL